MPMFLNTDEGLDEDPIIELEGQIYQKQQLIKLLKREIEDLEHEILGAHLHTKIHHR